MSEATLQAELKALFVASGTFANGSVLINETNVLDQSTENAPYLLILSADDVESVFRTGGVEIDYQEFVALVVKYDNGRQESVSRNAFTLARDSVVSTLRNNDLTTGRIQAFRTLTGIDPITYAGDPDGMPVFLAQFFLVTMRDDG